MKLSAERNKKSKRAGVNLVFKSSDLFSLVISLSSNSTNMLQFSNKLQNVYHESSTKVAGETCHSLGSGTVLSSITDAISK